jgi:hypothetical protein
MAATPYGNSTMATTKSLPYKTDSEYDIINVLKHRHEIPYHSRQFMWDREKYIGVLIDEAYKSWRASELHWLGFIIIYSGALNPAISDAQHRLTVCFLMILALSKLLTAEEPLNWISKYGTTSILGTAVPKDDQDILDKYSWARYPNIESCYEYDFEALGNILNDVPNTDTRPASKLYDAYEIVRDILTDILHSPEEKRSFLLFIHNDIKVTRMVITEWRFTLRVFNSLNNIKVTVPASILLKNVMATTIGLEHSSEIHAVFREWEIANSRTFEQFIHTMVNLFTRRLMTYDEYARRIAEVPTLAGLSAGSCPLIAFRESVGRAIEARDRLITIPYVKLLDLVLKSHEVITLCLWPIAYVAGVEQHAEVIRLAKILVAFALRYEGTFSFNPMSNLAFLRGIDYTSGAIGDLLQERQTVKATVDRIKAQLIVWLKDTGRSNEDVKKRIEGCHYSHSAFKRARCMLLFQAELTDSHEMSLGHDATHIDHIYPKTPGKSCAPLANPDNRHRIGNLTPFVGSNSGTVIGNSGLGNKPFDKKTPEYAKSNIAMTREVTTKYGATGFMDAQIEERSYLLAAQITALTAEVLGI